MPLLPLTGEFESDYYIVTGHMAFPQDSKLREWYINCQRFFDATQSLKKERWGRAMASFSPTVLREIIQEPKDVLSKYQKSMRDLYKATMIPDLLLSMHASGIAEPSVKKAIFYLSEFRPSEDEKPLFSDSTLKKLWSKYKAVAHLYLPLICDADLTFWLNPWSISRVDKGAFYLSLSYSGHLYELINSLPNRNSVGIYDGSEWTVPDDYIDSEPPRIKRHLSVDALKLVLDDYAVDRPL